MNRYSALSAVALSGVVLTALPSLALAASASSTVEINGTVNAACMLGAPSQTTLNLSTLTGTDGRLRSDLIGTTPSAQTQIDNAWCNSPNVLTLTASPLTLTTPPSYASPAGFSRSITYNVSLSGWSAPVTNRPTTTNNAVNADSDGAHAADPLGVSFSSLTPLVEGSETPTAYIEAGPYTATVSISLAVKP